MSATGRFFVQNDENHPLRLGVAIIARFGVSCVTRGVADHFLTTAYYPGRHWTLGWGSIGSTPLKEPLGTGARKSDLVLCAVVREQELSFGVGDVEIRNTQFRKSFHHRRADFSLFGFRLSLSLGGSVGLFAVGLSCPFRTLFQFGVKFKHLRPSVDCFVILD